MPEFTHPADYARAREVLARAEYTEEAVQATLGGASLLSTPGAAIPVWLRKTRGLSPHERESAARSGLRAVRLGPRILRTETAPLAALSVIQTLWGDFR